ncbi:MAG: hypothetical protein WAL71_01915 [Terriglobales bacterium]|jgi:hypothetical protein
MRPYFVLCAVLLIAVAAFGQQPGPRPYGPGYGFGPSVPLVTTPMISLETVSPNPVGASNATTGLIAGATNSTLSQIEGSTSSDYTVAVWYQGGAPLTTSEVNLWPEPVGREMHAMQHPGPEEVGREHGRGKEQRQGSLFFTGAEYTADVVAAASAGKGARKAGHVYTNDDVTRQNDNNGKVKYDGKTEKI